MAAAEHPVEVNASRLATLLGVTQRNVLDLAARDVIKRGVTRDDGEFKNARMVIYSAEGIRTIDERDVIAIYPGGGDGRYTHCTLVMRGGSEISGAVLNAALDALEAKLDGFGPPPIAA